MRACTTGLTAIGAIEASNRQSPNCIGIDRSREIRGVPSASRCTGLAANAAHAVVTITMPTIALRTGNTSFHELMRANAQHTKATATEKTATASCSDRIRAYPTTSLLSRLTRPKP